MMIILSKELHSSSSFHIARDLPSVLLYFPSSYNFLIASDFSYTWFIQCSSSWSCLGSSSSYFLVLFFPTNLVLFTSHLSLPSSYHSQSNGSSPTLCLQSFPCLLPINGSILPYSSLSSSVTSKSSSSVKLLHTIFIHSFYTGIQSNLNNYEEDGKSNDGLSGYMDLDEVEDESSY